MTRRNFLGMATLSLATIPLLARGSFSTTVKLTDQQKYTLLFMYQEEKLARDIYIMLGNTYKTATVFGNIQLSEQQHMDAVKNLCIKYGVNISNINDTQVGYFVIPELQNLYNVLLNEGRVSLRNALEVGVKIEEKDIVDIVEAEIGMPADVVKVFENLRAGSYNHLDAFKKALAAL